LPLPLKEDRLMTLFNDYDDWYEDHQGTQQRLSSEVLRVVQTMKAGQKVLIIGEKEDRGKETRIWLVHFPAIRLLLTRQKGCSGVAGGLCRPP